MVITPRSSSGRAWCASVRVSDIARRNVVASCDVEVCDVGIGPHIVQQYILKDGKNLFLRKEEMGGIPVEENSSNEKREGTIETPVISSGRRTTQT